jgi:hypothetical protein
MEFAAAAGGREGYLFARRGIGLMGRELQAGSRPPFRSLGILMLLACLIRPAQAEDLCGRLPGFDHTKA